MEDKKISGAEPEKPIAETPPNTPVPQASSTAVHRPEGSPMQLSMNVKEENYETRLSDIIGGLRFLGSKLEDTEAHISQTRSQASIASIDALARSSLGILKYDELQSFSEYTLDEDIHNLIQHFEADLASAKKSAEVGNTSNTNINKLLISENKADESDLATDLRDRLKKEMAQRTMERFSLPEAPTMEQNCSLISNRSVQPLQERCNDDKVQRSSIIGDTFTITNVQKKVPFNSKLGTNTAESEGEYDPYSFMNESLHSSSNSFFNGSLKDKMPQLGDFSNEKFVPGDQYEKILAADEAAWSKENIPPMVSPSHYPSVSQLDFSGIVGDAEISLPSNVGMHLDNLKKKISIGEYFKLRSEEPGHVLNKNNELVSEMQENETDSTNEDAPRESLSSTLSLTQIAGILGNLDACMSPRTLVAGFLKQAASTKSRSAKSSSCKESNRASAAAYVSPQETFNESTSKQRFSSYNDGESYNSTHPQVESVNSTSSTKNEWLFKVPRVSEGFGSRACSFMVNNTPKKGGIAEQQTITIEDSIASGDLSVLKLDEIAGRTVDKSVVCLTRELASKPKKTIDCSALLPTLKKHCPNIWSDEHNKANGQATFLDANAFAVARNMLPLSAASFAAQETPEQAIWASLFCPKPNPIICVGVPYEIVLPICNLTARWLLCGLTLDHVMVPGEEHDKGNNLAIINLPSKKVLMDPNNQKEARIEIVPVCEGNLEVVLQIHLEDVVTKATQLLSANITVTGEEPEIIMIKSQGHSTMIDFGTIPEECAETFTIKFRNNGKATVPLQLIAHTKVPKNLNAFILVTPAGMMSSESLSNDQMTTKLEFELKSGEVYETLVMFASPPMNVITEKERLCQLTGTLTIMLLGIFPLDLQVFELRGTVGTTKFALRLSEAPIKLISRAIGKSERYNLPLKNFGLVPFNLLLQMTNGNNCILQNGEFKVEPCNITLQPRERSEVTITFTPLNLQETTVCSVLRIQMQPRGPVYCLEFCGILLKSASERKEVSTVHLNNTSKNEDESLCIVLEKIQTLKATVQQPSQEKERLISGSPLLSRSPVSVSTKRSRSSSGSNNSDCMQCEKLRIQSTRRELVWGSVPVGQTVMRMCTIRSLAEHRCRMQVSLNDRNNVYKLMNDKGESVSQRKLLLHSKENLVLNVTFNPSKPGPLPAKLTFTQLPGRSEDNLSVHIPLYGCGGHTRLVVKGIPRDGAGRMWLTLQQQDAQEEIFWESAFSIRNIGDLPAFLKVKIISKGFHLLSEGSLIVEPSEVVISKGSQENIRVLYRPRSQELKLLMSTQSKQDVFEIATVNLISGDEPTRHRLRRLHKMMIKQKAVQKERYNDLDLSSIIAQFPGERSIPKLDSLKEPLDCIYELYHSCVSLQEVIILLENNNDRTIHEDRDLSRVFHSLHEVDISCTRLEETICCDTIQEETSFTDIIKSPAKCTWQMFPMSLMINPPFRSCASFSLKTESDRNQPFETCVPKSPSGWTLSVTPSSGFIPASDVLMLVVACTANNEASSSHLPSWNGIIQVFIENDCKELKVFVHYNPKQKQDLHKSTLQPKEKSSSPSSCSRHNSNGTSPHSHKQVAGVGTPTVTSHKLKSGTGSKPQELRVPLRRELASRVPKAVATNKTLIPSFNALFKGKYEQYSYKTTEDASNIAKVGSQQKASVLSKPTSRKTKKSPNSKT